MGLHERLKSSGVLKKLALNSTDAMAWHELYRLCRPYVIATLYHRFRGASDLAEDACQDVFIRLVNKCPFSELEPAAFILYLKIVCHHVASDYFRRMKTLRNARKELTPPPADFRSPLQEAEMRELLNDLQSVVGEKDGKVLALKLEGNSVADIASLIGLTSNATSARLWRLRRALRKYLQIRESQ